MFHEAGGRTIQRTVQHCILHLIEFEFRGIRFFVITQNDLIRSFLNIEVYNVQYDLSVVVAGSLS